MEPIPQQTIQAVVKTEAKEDRVGDIKTIYNVSGFTIFWRNFVAGFGRALGGIFIYLIFISITGYVFVSTVWPQVAPIFNSYMNMMNSLTSGGQAPTKSSGTPAIPGLENIQNDPLFQQLIQKYQK